MHRLCSRAWRSGYRCVTSGAAPPFRERVLCLRTKPRQRHQLDITGLDTERVVAARGLQIHAFRGSCWVQGPLASQASYVAGGLPDATRRQARRIIAGTLRQCPQFVSRSSNDVLSVSQRILHRAKLVSAGRISVMTAGDVSPGPNVRPPHAPSRRVMSSVIPEMEHCHSQLKIPDQPV